MRKASVAAFFLTAMLSFSLVGCGEPNVNQVVGQLQSVQNSLTSYKSAAYMTVHIQDTVQRYYVETWYQAPNLYRIALGNENKEISQIILHNATGIYIISPGSKRVIRFQGEWAEKQGHLYLYHSLLSKIISTENPGYRFKDQVASFNLPADPLNPMVSTQKIELAAGTYAPKQVTLYDKENHPVITMSYVSFQKGVAFAPDAFSTDQATTLKSVEMPVSAVEQGFGVIDPTWVPTADTLQQETEQGGVVYVRYDGSSPFTIAESRLTGGGIALGAGSLLTLYGIPAVVVGSGHLHQLYWMNHGVQFQLTSRMSVPDMVRVASSMIDETGK